MPAKIRIIHEHPFVTATVEGQLDFAQSKELCTEIASALGTSGNDKVIIDTRGAQSELSTTDLWYVAAELGNLRKDLALKTAVLCPPDQFDASGFFALCAHNRGFQVNTFTSRGAAVRWLLNKKTDA